MKELTVVVLDKPNKNEVEQNEINKVKLQVLIECYESHESFSEDDVEYHVYSFTRGDKVCGAVYNTFKLKPVTTNNTPENKYIRTIHNAKGESIKVDVYDVIEAFAVTNSAYQHAVKKLLACGLRGHKDNSEDAQDIVDSAIRGQQIENNRYNPLDDAPLIGGGD